MANFSGHNLTLVGSSLYCYGGYFFEKYNTTVRIMETGTRTTLESDMKNAFTTQDFADVTFRFPSEDNALIKAHKIVLAARSQKFRDMLQGRDEEDLTIDISDIPRELFQVLMELCYTDHLTSVRTHARTHMDACEEAVLMLDLVRTSVSPPCSAAVVACEGVHPAVLQAHARLPHPAG
jgi:hypothetical protein